MLCGASPVNQKKRMRYTAHTGMPGVINKRHVSVTQQFVDKVRTVRAKHHTKWERK